MENLKNIYTFRTIRQEEAGQASAIEQICFSPREACAPKNMEERIKKASPLFLVAAEKETDKIVGFVNGLSTHEEVFRDEYFTNANLYEPDGKNVFLLGVAVLPKHRGTGLAKALMAEFIRRLREEEIVRNRVILTCHNSKVPMYEKMGFTDGGISASSWGGETWHEMFYQV